MSLDEIREEIKDGLGELFEVIASGYPTEDVGDVFESTSRHLEALGCCKLLLDLDVDRFHRDLIWAGYARRRYLQRSRAEANVSQNIARSRCDSFFCAMAAGDDALAIEIGSLSPNVWVPDGEYEEDFAYFRFLHLLLEGADAATTAVLLTQLKDAQGGASPRLAVAEAFQAADAAAFEAAFVSLVDARNIRVDAEKVTFMDDITYVPRANIFVEGLALLRLAELRRLGPQRREYPRCPYAARVSRLTPSPEDVFLEMEQEAGL